MDIDTKVNIDFKEAFNLGYELAKELNLKSPMFKDLYSANIRMNAMQAGMAQYSNELKQEQRKDLDLDNELADRDMGSKEEKNRDKDKGWDMSI